LELEMKVAADNRAGAVDLVHRMEGSKHFQKTQLVGEQSQENGQGVSATISALYIPDAADRSGNNA